MLIIAHRGNIDGPSEKENHPDYIRQAIDAGYKVEVDIFYDGKLWCLGHDYALYDVPRSYIRHLMPSCYFHAKDLKSLYELIHMNANVFYHNIDSYALTSDKKIWTYPLKDVLDDSIIVCQSKSEVEKYVKSQAYGICTDYCHYAKSLL